VAKANYLSVMHDAGIIRGIALCHATPEGTMEPAAFRERYVRLTPRQREILLLRCRGATNEEVARQLYLQEQTIKNHMTRILAQMDLRGRRGSAVVCSQIQTLWAASATKR
jgi:DNA-binding CsgD family transcriptional regulator